MYRSRRAAGVSWKLERKGGRETLWRLTLELIAVLDVGLPVAGLTLDVEGQAGRTLDGRQPRHADLGCFVAPKRTVL